MTRTAKARPEGPLDGQVVQRFLISGDWSKTMVKVALLPRSSGQLRGEGGDRARDRHRVGVGALQHDETERRPAVGPRDRGGARSREP